MAIAGVGALVAASFAGRLEEDLGPRVNRPAVAAAVEQARRQPLAAVEVTGAPPAVRREVEEAASDASVGAFRMGMGIAAALVALGGILGLAGIRNPRRVVEARECPGGQLAGTPAEGARTSPCDWGRAAPDLEPSI